MKINNQTTRKEIHFNWLVTIFIAFACGCEGLDKQSIRPDPESILLGFLQSEYYFHDLYEPPDTAFIVKDTASTHYDFWDGLHKYSGSESICDSCGGWALNTGDGMYSGIAMLDWDRHSETYTTNLGTYADDVVSRLEDLNWDTNNWDWPPKISSAWRNPDRNERSGGLDTSLHMFGRAIDFDGENQEQLDLLFQAVYDVGGKGIKKNEPTGWMHAKFPPF